LLAISLGLATIIRSDLGLIVGADVMVVGLWFALDL